MIFTDFPPALNVPFSPTPSSSWLRDINYIPELGTMVLRFGSFISKSRGGLTWYAIDNGAGSLTGIAYSEQLGRAAVMKNAGTARQGYIAASI
jgi:hypothetical protein